MRRKLYSFVFALLAICSVWFAMPAAAADSGYVIEQMQVDVVVDEARVYYVTETITINYLEERQGIYRTLPTIGRSEDYTIENIQVEGAPFVLEYPSGYIDIRIGEAGVYVTGEQTYVITYEIHHYQDYLQNGDYIYMNLVGSEWDTTIKNFSGSITYPQGAAFDRLVITSGKDSADNTENQLQIQSSHEGNVIYFSSTSAIKPGNAVTANIRLAEGTFYNAPVYEFPYTIDTLDVTVSVNKAKEYTIQQTYAITIDDPTALDGYKLYLPLTMVTDAYDSDDIENLQIKTDFADNAGLQYSKPVCVFSAHEAGTYTTSISYTVTPKVEADIYLSLLPTLEAPITQINLTVVGGDVALPAPSVTTGRMEDEDFGIYEVEQMGSAYSVKTNTTVYPSEQFLVTFDIPKSAFHRPLPTSVYALLIVSGILVLISFVIFMLVGRDDKIIPVVEVYPPDHLNAPEIGYIVDNKTDAQEVTNIIYNWAAGGYLQIVEEGDKNLRLRKLRDMNGDEQAYEKTLFNSMFAYGTGNEVTASQLKNKFYSSLGSAAKSVEKKYQKAPTNLYEKNRVYQTIIMVMAFAPIVGLVVVLTKVLGFGSLPSIYSIIIPFFIIYILVGSLRNIFSQKISFSMILILFINSLLPMLLFGYVFMRTSSLLEIDFGIPLWPILFTVACTAIMIVLSWLTKKRSAYGTQMIGRVRGFKGFLQVAEKSRLEMLLEENPDYFYDILPYALVLGVSKQWMDKFADLALPPPTWYVSSSTDPTYRTDRMVRDMSKRMNSFVKTANSRPASSGSSGGSSSYGGSSGGGYSGGGSSGGGSGGGGGRSW